MPDTRTIAQWCHYLTTPDAELTLSELMAKCLIDIRDNLVVNRLANEHVEGIMTTLDAVMAETNETYGAIAERRTRPPTAALGTEAGRLLKEVTLR